METDLCEVQTSTIASIVVVAIHVKDLLALDRQQAREDTFGETSTEHDDLRTASDKQNGKCAAKQEDITSYSSSMVG